MNGANEISPHLPSVLPGTALSRTGHEGFVTPAGGVDVVMKAKLLVVVCLYLAALLWAYATIVVPGYGYEGFALRWPNAVQVAWLVAITLLPVLFLPGSSSRPSVLVLWWLYLTVYIPSIMVPALSLSTPSERLLPLQLTLLLCMGILSWASSTHRLLSIGKIAVSPALFWSVFWTMWVVGLGTVIGLAHFSSLVGNITSLFHGADEYTIRGKYIDLGGEFPFLGYIEGQVTQALNPFLMAFGLRYRNRACLLAGIAGQIVTFSLTGFKASVASIAFLYLLSVFIRRWRRSLGLALASGLMIAVVGSTVFDRATDTIFFTHVFTRRTVLTPGLLTGFYFEHYSQVPHAGLGVHFSWSRDERVLTPPNEIGFAYFDDANVNANANLWAEGYAEIGLLGMVLYTVVWGLAMWLYDSVAAGRDPTMAMLQVAMPAAEVSNTLPSTVLVTHGGLAAALVLYFAPLSKPSEAAAPRLSREYIDQNAGNGTIIDLGRFSDRHTRYPSTS